MQMRQSMLRLEEIKPTHLHSHLPLLHHAMPTQAKSKESASQRTQQATSFCKLDTKKLWTDRRATDNKGLPKAGVTSFYDTLVLNRTLVFQINGSAEMPRLRQAPNRQAVKIPL